MTNFYNFEWMNIDESSNHKIDDNINISMN